MEENKTNWISVFLFFLTGITTGFAGFLYGKEYIEIVHNVITSFLGVGVVLFLMAYSNSGGEYSYDNAEHKLRFLFIFTGCLFMSVMLPLIPEAGWPYLAIFILLALFSNMTIGITSGTLLLMISVLNCGNGQINVFYMYFVSGIAGVALFQQLDETYKVGTRVFTSLLVLLVSLSTGYALFLNEIFTVQLFLIPVVNLFVSLLLLMVVLKLFSAAVVHKYREIYLDLNDQECPLLVQLKKTDKEEYLHAVHTAYLCDKLAMNLYLNEALMKAGGYYHRIGSLKGDNTWENIEGIGREYRFPPGLMKLLKEYNDKDEALLSKEAAVLMFSDMVVSVIRSMFRQNAEVKLDYVRLLEAIFRKIDDSGKINTSKISMEERDRIQKVLLEEKLYYDFLR